MNGFWDVFSSEPSLENDKASGTRILQGYFDQASQFQPFLNENPDFESFLSNLDAKMGYSGEVGQSFAEDVGALVRINNASTSEEDAQSRLIELGETSQGQATLPQLMSHAGGRGDAINWSAALPAIASESVSDLVEKASSISQGVGTGVFGTLSLVKYLPWILLGGGALAIYSFSKSSGKQAGYGLRAVGESIGARVRGK